MTIFDDRILAAIDHPPLPLATVSHESLVAGHLLRLQSTDPTPVVLSGVLALTPEMTVLEAQTARWARRFNLSVTSTFAMALPIAFFYLVGLAAFAPPLFAIMTAGLMTMC